MTSASEGRLVVAWLVALAATLGSLYFSEVRLFVPCTLCWVQRICMYPLALVLGVAVYVGDTGVRRYALPLVVTGWVVALVHVLEELGVVSAPAACVVGVPCSVRWVEWWGVVTIPVLSLTAFSLLVVVLAPPLRSRVLRGRSGG